ncbi:hypothetical protein [Bacillus cereus group sp. BfR-BA-01315]|uniref:hypothetical protein n=1 Tax=Bacillus cereus group sp. BfR-BA-01315 TaxID=2920292 RepID=UPI001F58FE86|nr:hypothetical protein [Bacillus cereus group sp. BfR-BA-01315]
MKKLKKGKVFLAVACGALLIGGSYFVLHSNQVANESESVSVSTKGKTKERIAIHGELDVSSFKETLSEADLVVKVKIGDKVKEFNEPSPGTLYNAKVQETLKGQAGADIKVLQQGNSDYSFNGNPLFTKGQEFILVLKKAVGLGENVYWLLGEETQIYQVVGDGSLKRWAAHDASQFEDIEDKAKTEAENKGVVIQRSQSVEQTVKQKENVQILNESQFKEKVKNNQ